MAGEPREEFPPGALAYDSEGRLNLFGRTVILLSRSALATLQADLEQVLGERSVRLAMARGGREMGRQAAERYSDIGDDRAALSELLAMASMAGWMSGVEILEFSGDSFRVRAAHTYGEEFPGRSGSPVCHLISGLLSGFMSARLGRRVVVLETSCVARGDPYCEFSGRVT